MGSQTVVCSSKAVESSSKAVVNLIVASEVCGGVADSGITVVKHLQYPKSSAVVKQ